MNEKISAIDLNKNTSTPLFRQLADAILSLIADGSISPDEKLPSVRVLSAALGINTGTAAAAYSLLEQRGAVYKKQGSGTYCRNTGTDRPAAAEIIRRKRFYAGREPFADLTRTSVSDVLFPVARFRDIFDRVLERDKGEAFSYQPSAGYQPLRQNIARLLADRAIKTSADRVQIISGSQQGIDLVARAVIGRGDTVLFEKYTYLGAVNAMLAQGADIQCVNMDSSGICLDELEEKIKKYRPVLLYVMPCFQTPTGISYSLETKRGLLNLAYKYDLYIIEEDNSGDFNYSDSRMTPLKALDYKNKVIYIKSFSKILMPGLRLGYMVLPKAISESIARLKYSTDISTSGFIQRAFDLFLQGSGWERHKDEIRTYFAQKYEYIHSRAKKQLSPYFDISDPCGGLILWLKLRDTDTDADVLCQKLAEAGIAVIPGSFYSPADKNVPYIALSFADVTDEEIDRAISGIADIME